jgi:hypothetical protein
MVVLAGLAAVLAFAVAAALVYVKMRTVQRLLGAQSAQIAKVQILLSRRQAMNAVAENAEMVYQGLAQHIAPIARELGVPPRDSQEHLLWRILGGLLDEYGKNPFVLEKLRRGIKLDPEIARGADMFLEGAGRLLRHMSDIDATGLLSATFTDGLLGQAAALLSRAKHLAK